MVFRHNPASNIFHDDFIVHASPQLIAALCHVVYTCQWNMAILNQRSTIIPRAAIRDSTNNTQALGIMLPGPSKHL